MIINDKGKRSDQTRSKATRILNELIDSYSVDILWKHKGRLTPMIDICMWDHFQVGDCQYCQYCEGRSH